MPEFVASSIINAPVDRVFGFHERPDALARLSPPFPPVTVIRRTGGLEPGARVELRIGPVRWTAQHTEYLRNRFFVDEQVRGPFASWVHRHEFEALGERTRLTDRVVFRLRGGRVVNAAMAWLVRLALRPMFAWRHRATRAATQGTVPLGGQTP